MCCCGLSDRQGFAATSRNIHHISCQIACKARPCASQCDVQHVRNVHRLEMVAGKSEDCRGSPHLSFGQRQYVSPFRMNFINLSDIFQRWTLWNTPTWNKRPRKHTHCRAEGIFFFFLITANFNFFSPHETILIAAAFITFSAGRSTSPVCATWPAAVTHHCSSQKEKAEWMLHLPSYAFSNTVNVQHLSFFFHTHTPFNSSSLITCIVLKNVGNSRLINPLVSGSFFHTRLFLIPYMLFASQSTNHCK